MVVVVVVVVIVIVEVVMMVIMVAVRYLVECPSDCVEETFLVSIS